MLLALGYLLVDALSQHFFAEPMSQAQRIDALIAALKGIVVRLTQGKPQ